MRVPLSRQSQTIRAVFARLAQIVTTSQVFTPKANNLNKDLRPLLAGALLLDGSIKRNHED